MYKYFKKISNTGYVSEWKSINAETIVIMLMIHEQNYVFLRLLKHNLMSRRN